MWAQDEARYGLHPTIRRVYAPRGKRPVARQRKVFKWFYLYAFVEPASGEVYWLLLPTVSTVAFGIALEHFARDMKAGPNNRFIIVMDRAGFHVGKDLIIPEGIHFLFLPSYSPQLQPAEQLWPMVNDHVHNQCFDRLEDLEDVVEYRCELLSARRSQVQGRCLFGWWSTALIQAGLPSPIN